ncbi:phosphatidylinositol-specific phospholipase C/glycerophosphodiester phosphodiesterase family protein [Paenibacillus sp. MMS20-IR301]|uniref:phosphatidylinositol-specific phospholipase C/glycerophosphodiester phosphodiesterase family protein n=1 Tax=Paenibacillus sp. MMS20-IR301 TaxID=2895946 RepID=UPI0028EE68FD|nr:phosphatidylinositol-specific phospholipase C/glycerophosphodiester phosphodiesterase family protein [Paenibacillus sp. MMS20-IR301]WNS42748.1 phosphatidylinositol-specific phospholipase C/glycerophosphodiester phosphodiesterase family protein [Paenibacillus sp. MMS20-IR301]
MDRKKLIASIIMIGAVALLLVLTLGGKKEQPATGFAAYRVVAHAMGGIHDSTYTNSLDAFIANYEQGTRVFEADLLLTSDNKLVARHEWTANMSKLLGQQTVLPADKQGTVLSYEEVMDSPILEIYSPLDIDKIMNLLVIYPDAYLVTDTKELEPEKVTKQFQLIVEAAEKRDPALLQRIVPQVYSRDMRDVVNQVYAFPEMIFTLYQTQDSDETVIEFVKQTGVDITMPTTRATKSFVRKLTNAGARVYVHTVNDEEEIRELSRMGVNGFYTDFVSENDLNLIKGVR